MDYEEWHKSKDELPPLGEVIEGIGPKDWIYSELKRDYFALVAINQDLVWLTPSLNDIDYKDLKIKYWRFIPPDPKGKKAYIKVKIRKKTFEYKVIFS
jgi:hypothetical protein